MSPLFGRRERLWPLLLVSLALHVVVGGIAVVHRPAPIIDLQQKPIRAKLVRLGPKREAQLLPRKEVAPPPPVAAAPVPIPGPVAPAPAPPKRIVPPAPAPAPKPVARGPVTAPAAPRPDALASALSRIRREQALAEPAPGDPSGDPLGDSAEAGEGDRYLALVDRALHESYRVPATLSDVERRALRATVVLFIEPDGRVGRYQFEARSGSPTFDDALERAIRSARLPPPPTELRERYRSVGVGVHFHM